MSVPDLTIRPHQGVGVVDFGMSLAEVEAALGPPTDRHGDIFWYFDDEVEVHFDGSGACSFLQIHPRSFASVSIAGIPSVRFTEPWSDVVAALMDEGVEIFDVERGATYDTNLGFGLWRDVRPSQRIGVVVAWAPGSPRTTNGVRVVERRPEWAVRPGRGFGEVDFGLTREQIADRLGEPNHWYRSDHRDGYTLGAYDRVGLTLELDARGACNFLTVNRTCLPALDGLSLFLEPSDDVVAHIAALGEVDRALLSSGEMVCEELGLALRAAMDGTSRFDQLALWQVGTWDGPSALQYMREEP